MDPALDALVITPDAWYLAGLDFVDMIDRCANYRYLIIVVGPYSRWIEAGPCVCYTESAATFLVQLVIPSWGCQMSSRLTMGSTL